MSAQNSEELEELLHEVKVCHRLEELQGEYIPYEYWDGYFSVGGGEWYGMATALCEPATTHSPTEEEKVLERLHECGVLHGDVRKILLFINSSKKKKKKKLQRILT